MGNKNYGVGTPSDSLSSTTTPQTTRRSRARQRRIEPYAWLTAGAVSVGIAAAVAGSGVAYADDTGSESSSTSSESRSTTSASTKGNDESTTKSPSNKGPRKSDPASTSPSDHGSDSRASKNDKDSEDKSDDDAETESAAPVSDGNSPEVESGDADDSASELGEPTDADADLETDIAPAPETAEDSKGSETRATRPDTRSDNDPVRGTATEADDETTITAPEVPEPTEDVAASPLDPSGEVAPADGPPAAVPNAASDAVELDTTDSVGAQAATTVAVTDAQPVTQPAAPAAPETLADLLRAFFIGLETTFTPTAQAAHKAGQSSQMVATGSLAPGVVTGTVPGATGSEGGPATVKLSGEPNQGSVQVTIDGNYTYTPSAALAASGGTDTFTVTVTTPNPPETGLRALWSALIRTLTFGLVQPAVSTTVTQTVTVTVPKTAGVVIEDPVGPTPVRPPGTIYAGLSDPFQMPTASTGKTLNVRDYGATSNRSSDNDAVAIQKAINAAQAGDVVYIPNGTYHIKTTISLKTGVSLIGESRDATVLATAFSVWSHLFSNPHAVLHAARGVNDLTLSSFTITQATGKSYDAGVRLGGEGDIQVSRIAVKDLYIEKHRRFGVQLQNAYQVLVSGNVIRDASALDGGGSGYGIIIDQPLSNNNWITNNVVGPVIRHGILVQHGAHHNLIERNTITGTVSSAIDLHGEDEYSNEIRYNTISNGVRNGTSVSPNGAGIEVGEYSGVIGSSTMHDKSGPMNWIHHNVVYNYNFGLRIVNNSNYTYIENNIFYDNWSAGIQADLAPLNNLHISGNEIYNNASGIILYDVTQAFLKDNVIRNNRNYGLWTNAGVTGYTITGNTVTNNGIDVVLGSQNGTYIPDAA